MRITKRYSTLSCVGRGLESFSRTTKQISGLLSRAKFRDNRVRCASNQAGTNERAIMFASWLFGLFPGSVLFALPGFPATGNGLVQDLNKVTASQPDHM